MVEKWTGRSPQKGLKMIANVKARYSNGVLTLLEPLDLEDGKEVMVSIEDALPPVMARESILEMFERLRKSVPPEAWDDMPTDGAKNYKHYLYGHPKVED